MAAELTSPKRAGNYAKSISRSSRYGCWVFEAYGLLLCKITRGSEDHNDGVLLQLDIARVGVNIRFNDSVSHGDEIRSRKRNN